MTSVLRTDSFASLSVLHLTSPSHLLASSCSPDKDLLLVISRLGSKDTISLWKMQGGKKWEVDVSTGDAAHEEVTGVAWSPDGMSILIAHHPPRMSIHSIQDGRLERTVSFRSSLSTGSAEGFRISNIWWIKHEAPKKKEPDMPDFFKRNKTIPGSALSQLKMQPLLDPLKDDTAPIMTSDLFSFQGVLPTSTTKIPRLPNVIANWPALPPDLIAASIKPFPRPGDPQHRPDHPRREEFLDDAIIENSLNYDSLVVAADDRGRCHFFMDATYSLGDISVGECPEGARYEVTSVITPPSKSCLLLHATYKNDGGITNLFPMPACISSLQTSQAREVARSCSAARELAWYMLRVIDEMRHAWVGCDEHGEGASSLGPKWVKEIETRQKLHHPAPRITPGEENATAVNRSPNPIADLTILLTTGRPSEALCDVFGHLGERGLGKWETTMTEALTKMRDFAEKRLAFATQRMVILLQEAAGRSRLPQLFGDHGFQNPRIELAQRKCHMTIVLCAWVALTAREQLWRFKEFKLWLQYESNKMNTETDDGRIRPLSWDVLQVNRYLMDGLDGCGLDRCFNDPKKENKIPSINFSELMGWPKPNRSIGRILDDAKAAIDRPDRKPWEKPPERVELSEIDRNIEALVKGLVEDVHEVFVNSGVGIGQRVVVHKPCEASLPKGNEGEGTRLRMRERTVFENGRATQYVLTGIPRHGERRERLCLLKLQFETGGELIDPHFLGAVVIECHVGSDKEESAVDVLDFEFFDDDLMVLVLKLTDGGAAYVATMGYGELEYRPIEMGPRLAGDWREKVVGDVTATLECGLSLRLTGSRKLCLRSTEGASLSVNGRVGRRTVCVIDGKGLEIEVLDMAEDEGAEEDDEMRD